MRHELVDGRCGQNLDQVGAVGRGRGVGAGCRGVAVGDVHVGGDEVAVVAAHCEGRRGRTTLPLEGITQGWGRYIEKVS